MSHRLLSSLAVLALVLAPPLADAAAQDPALAIYDNFNSAAIDATKWRGVESNSSTALVLTESRRGIVNGKLKLEITAHGGTGSNTGLTGEARNRLLINHPALVDGAPRITVLRSVITVMRSVAENCAASDRPTRTHAGMFGFFLNDESGTDALNDFEGDVFATFDFRHDSRVGNTIEAVVARCVNPGCSTAALIGTVTFARKWATGVPIVAIIRWQPENNRFGFTASSADLGNETRFITYTLPDTKKSKAFAKDLRVSTSAANCSAGAVEGSIDARFDDVRINATAVDATQ